MRLSSESAPLGAPALAAPERRADLIQAQAEFTQRSGLSSARTPGRELPPMFTWPMPAIWEIFWARMDSARSEEHTSELQSRVDLVCRLLLEKKKKRENKS